MSGFGRAYLRLVAVSVGTAVALAGLGAYPTWCIAGSPGLVGLAVGIALSLLGGCLGSIPIGLAQNDDPRRLLQAVLLATALRGFLVLGLTAGTVLLTTVARGPTVLWVGLSYLALLTVDTVYAVRIAERTRKEHP